MNRTELITFLDEEAMENAKKQWNTIAKPLHSMGKFEELIVRIAGISGTNRIDINKKCTVVMCADNGVVEEGVTQSESDITVAVANAMLMDDGNINVLSNTYNSDVIVVDIGMKYDIDSGDSIRWKNKFYNKKISNGTANIKITPAMSKEQAYKAIQAGIDIVRDCVENGYKIIATGEMGIGNTTTSSAVASVILDKEAKEVTGRGAGLKDESLIKKISVIEEAIRINNPHKDDAIDIVSKIGGYDIAGIMGVFLGGAIYKIPIVIDGFISATAAALAYIYNHNTREYMIASHVSKEPAAKWILDFIGVNPIIHGDMCLGEGTGAVMMFPLLDGAINMYNSSHLFEELEIKQYEDYGA